ncbi:MAG: RNA polymerase sigma factor [Planctomycetes bacterium]|nr:RNA polymerase sigma factor [Planctomycetota bacterium]MCB9868764.1 RNA polymerase sigma factor [Planctomycetota bacterium]
MEPTPPATRPTLPQDTPDPELVARLRSGDPGAFQLLVRPVLPSLLRLARRLTGDPHWADDLVQETLVRAVRSIASFRGDASLRTWLFRIQLRLAAQPQRWRRTDPATALLDPPDVPAHPPEDDPRARELAERLDEAMERLTPRQRTALHLRAVEGLDYRAIGALLDTTAGAARMLVLAARRQVMQRMGRHLLP